MQGSLFNLSFDNYGSTLLAFFPGLLNVAIVIYVLLFLPRSRTTNIFVVFVITLILWQADDVLMRISLSEETARHWDGILSLGWIFLAPVGLHFACIYTKQKTISETRLGITLIYLPFILFETFYRTGVEHHIFKYNEVWGWVNEPNAGTLEEIQRYCIPLTVVIAAILFFRDSYRAPKHSNRKYRSLLIAIGLFIPTIQGTLTQVVFPLLVSTDEIPVTSSFMTFFSVACLIALNRYKLFSVSESVSVDTVLENLADIVFIVSPKKQIIYFNPHALRTLGLSQTDVEGFSLANLFPEGTSSYEQFNNIVLKSSFKGTCIKNFDTEFVTRDEKKIQVLLSSDLLVSNNVVQGVLMVARDITRQKFSEQLLRNSQAQLMTAQQIAHIGSWEWDISTNKLVWSDEMYRIFGLVPATVEPTVKSFLLMIHHDDIEHVQSSLDRLFQKRRPVKLNHRIVRTDGIIRTMEGRAEIVSDATGKPVRLIGTTQDITEIKNEEELEKMAMVAAKSYNAVIIADKNGNIEWVNEGFQKLTGYSLEEVKGTTAEMLRKGEQTGLKERHSLFETLMESRKPLMYECRNYSKTGKEYWVLSSITPIVNMEGAVEKIICIDSDITKLKQVEEALRNEKRLTDELMQIKEQFLANISHEIRTPMNAIIGLTDVLLKGKFTKEQTDYLRAIKNSGTTLMVIINDILDVSKLEAGKMTLEETRFDLQETVGYLMELFQSKAKEKKIILETYIDSEVPRFVVGDSVRFSQVLMNLLSNSVKFTASGKVSLDAAVEQEDEHTLLLRFSVSDSGIGIQEDKLKIIFDSFTQAAPDVARRFGGTGLGLNIVKGLVELHGGKVMVKSQVGEGSTFSFTVRFGKEMPGSPPVGIIAESVFPENCLVGKSALLVEDNEVNRMLAEKVLLDWGCHVHTAENGNAAIEKMKTNKYDFILMDILMPVMDGYETARYIRKQLKPPASETPIIALTAHAALWESRKCLEAGMNDYLSKPFSSETLFARIAALVSPLNRLTNAKFENEPVVTKVVEMKEFSVIDLTYLRGVSRGSNEFVKKMIHEFLQRFPANILLLQQHLEKKDWDSLYFLAHKMKPSITFMGIKELEPVILEVERSSKELKNLELIPALMRTLSETGGKAIEELKMEMKSLDSRV